jgi:AraC-like DNA-binding protein
MKPILEHLPKQVNESFVMREFEYAYFPMPWHYHPEYELVYVVESSGTRFIGSTISEFEAGSFSLIGQNVPHVYRNRPEFYQPDYSLQARSIVVHFLPQSLGEDFLRLPEAAMIQELLARSQFGLDVTGNTHRKGKAILYKMLTHKGMHRWLLLIELLQLLAESNELVRISHSNLSSQNPDDASRLNQVFDYIFTHFTRDIRQEEVACLLAMTNSSFSRYFKQRTHKSFIEFVTQVRLAHAGKLLIGGDLSIIDICFRSGFNNVSNFNRHFKRFYGLNPQSYQKRFRLNTPGIPDQPVSH